MSTRGSIAVNRNDQFVYLHRERGSEIKSHAVRRINFPLVIGSPGEHFTSEVRLKLLLTDTQFLRYCE